jgi:hypothetical protein
MAKHSNLFRQQHQSQGKRFFLLLAPDFQKPEELYRLWDHSLLKKGEKINKCQQHFEKQLLYSQHFRSLRMGPIS